jgi:tetratricopeptide (TPR) repeat protein
LGGVGKTQTAVEYAYRHLGEYEHVLWVGAQSGEALVSGYSAIAGLLKLPLTDPKNQTLAVEAVRRWLDSHERWLLVLDNADDLATAREFLPSGNRGHVLLTSRAWAAGTVARRVEIEEMGLEEGALFLLRRAKRIAEDAPLEAADPADQKQAREITLQLGGLPLALDQAGAYLEETACGLSGYLVRYQKHAPALLRQRGMLAVGHPDPVASTWALSFENVEQANPAAAELLRFCAFLYPDGIPEELFSIGTAELGPALEQVGSDALALDAAVAELLKYSLIRRDPNARTLEIHRLVQAVLKQGMDEATRRSWAERAVRAVNRTFPKVEFSTWAVCDRLLPQVQACAELTSRWGFEFSDAARLLNQAGFYLYKRGRYIEAEQLYRQALTIYGALPGAEPDLANSLNNLARLYRAQSRYTEAEPLFQRALAIWEKVLGSEDPNVAQCLTNLAELYRTQGRYAEAQPLYQRALAIREKILGPEHPNVAASLNSLGDLYLIEGQIRKAEPLFQRALAIREEVFGSEHPDVAWSLNSLAELHRAQGRYAEAEPFSERALAIRERTLGPDHPHVATSLENYAALLRAMDRPDEAAPLEARAKAIRAKRA